jgi:uncharacterized protein YjiS (DUF1127 family)
MRISNATFSFHGAPARPVPAGPGLVTRAVAALQRVRERARERHQLLGMTSRELHDIGLSNVDAWREANKPLWRE